MAVSLTEMLVARGGKAKFLEFGRLASREGAEAALERHYDIREVTSCSLSGKAGSALKRPLRVPSSLTTPVHVGYGRLARSAILRPVVDNTADRRPVL